MRVGFVGLGNIGKPMALRLAADDGIDLWVYDVMHEPVAELEEAGARGAASIAALAGRSDVICVMVRDDDQVRDVLGEILRQREGRSAADGQTVVIHSTVAPSTPGELADTAARHGVMVVDAPVSGGSMGAADGTPAIMVGGSDEAFAAARPALDAMGSLITHAGPIGSGTKFKLARNLMHFVAFTAATEAQRLAEASGLDVVELGKVVRHTDQVTGGPGAIMLRNTAGPIEEGDFWMGVYEHVWELGKKDLTFAIDLADQQGVDVPLARLSLERLREGLGLE
jgi:3-hydroxyisobutyrate dehydrogenase-like beta-hydroxyacid dehydrogenase